MRQRIVTSLALLRLALPYAAFLVLRRAMSLETLVRFAWSAPTRRTSPGDPGVLVARVRRLSQFLSPGADCLPRSLLLYRELSKLGADPRLVIGFAGSGTSLIGHAWVLVDGAPIGESVEQIEPLTSVCAFGARGAIVNPQ